MDRESYGVHSQTPIVIRFAPPMFVAFDALELLEVVGHHVAFVAIDPAVRSDWAQSLADWPQTMATELDGQGLPASEVLKLTLEAAEKHGYEWPVRYEIQ